MENGVKKDDAELHLRAGRQVRRLRLQQEPRGGLRAGQLSHGLSEGELPRGVPGRLDDARHGQHRQAGACSRPRRAKSGIAVLPPCVNASDVEFLAEAGARRRAQLGAIRYSLAALKNIGAARSRRSSPSGRRRAATSRSPTSPRGSIPRRSTSARWKRWRMAGAFDALEPNRALVHANVERIMAWRSGWQANADSARPICSALGEAKPPRAATAAARRLDADGAAAARVRGGRLLSCPAIRSISTRRCWRSSASGATPSSRR